MIEIGYAGLGFVCFVLATVLAGYATWAIRDASRRLKEAQYFYRRADELFALIKEASK